MANQNFVFVKKIGKNWVLNFQLACGLSVYLGLFIALVGYFLPSSWHVTYLGIAIALTYPLWAYLESYFFSKLLKCTSCGFNLTYGKTTNRPLHPSVAMNRLSEYKECPKCGYGS